MEPLEVDADEPVFTDMPVETGSKQGRVSLARVVQVLGNLNGQSRMSSRKSAAAGGALREIYPGLSPAAAASIANHMRNASRESPLLLMHDLQANLEAALPELVPSVPVGARPTKAGGAPKKTRAAPKKAAAKGGGSDTGYGGGLGGKSLSLTRALAV